MFTLSVGSSGEDGGCDSDSREVYGLARELHISSDHFSLYAQPFPVYSAALIIIPNYL